MYICKLNLILSLILCCSGRSNKRGDIIKTTGCVPFIK